MIVHILSRAEWADAQRVGEYRTTTLPAIGFIHCSDPGTVHLPADRLFAGRTDLILLLIDPTRLTAPLRWEPGDPAEPAGPWFPHVYGPIALAAVVDTLDFPPDEHGRFQPPPALAAPEFEATS